MLWKNRGPQNEPTEKTHKLIDIIAIAVCAAIAGADTWTGVHAFGKGKREWLETFLELENGIPSHDTFGRVFSLLDPIVFQRAFRQWVAAIQGKVEGVVAIDGKAVRRSHDNAKEILGAGGDYLLAVKGNQETLAEDVEQEFKLAQANDFAHMDYHYHETTGKDHGRIEKRQYWYTHDIQGLGTIERWPQLKGMVMCRATRTLEGQTSVQDRYFITSCIHHDVEKIAAGVRNHWAIENSLHWVLDVVFLEDHSRIRMGYAAENMATLRKIAHNALKKNTSRKSGIKEKRLQAAWDERYLEEILRGM